MRREQTPPLWLNQNEKQEINQLWKICTEDLQISERRKGEIYAQGIINHLQDLIATHVPHTQTKTQRSNLQQKRDFITDFIENIKQDSYIYLEDAIKYFFFGTNLFDHDIRTQSNWFHKLLSSSEISLFYLPYYTDKATFNDIILVHKKSQWYPQLRKHMFSVNNDFLVIKSQSIKFNDYKTKLLRTLKFKSPRFNMDRVEKVMFNSFLYYIKKLMEKPIYDNTDIVLQETIRLRSELKFPEAEELLQQEKDHKQKQGEGEVQFLNAIGGDLQ